MNTAALREGFKETRMGGTSISVLKSLLMYGRNDVIPGIEMKWGRDGTDHPESIIIGAHERHTEASYPALATFGNVW